MSEVRHAGSAMKADVGGPNYGAAGGTGQP
jgi:hypothetical protein